jgi:hypothetical protein
VSDAWNLKGTLLIACNCDWGCPCNFNAPPTTGKCEGGWTWHVDEGSYGDKRLDDLNFSVYVNWPGAIHEGNGEALVLVDERADDVQRSALETLISGDAGGPWGILAWTWPTVHGPFATEYELELNGVRSTLRAGDYVELVGGPMRNPVSGDETSAGIVLPQGILVKAADLGASESFRVANGISYDHTGQYISVGDFDYAGP